MQRRAIAGAFLAGFLGIAGAGPIAAAPFQFPPIVEPENYQEHHVGKVIFVELMTPDIGAAKQFYGNLFGWTFRDFQGNTIRYVEAYLDGRPVAGMIQRDVAPGQRRQPAWLTFIASRDVNTAKVIALQRGARVLFEPRTVPNRGQQAIFVDPQGAVFAVLASSSGDPPDELAAPGEWIWSSLMTSDPEMGAAFYQAMFDYDVFELPPTEGAQRLMLATENYARASVNPLAVNDPNSRSHWLNFVRVDDAVRMAARVTALGGRVLVEPRPDRHGGMVAVVADPMGAPFGLLEWTDSQSKEVGK
ncbi:MAG TPA: VOC family protein [Usitatibacter sp.]|nr:VOC family protein [Usitatibacter sp.]